jgi:hypothetical protein
MSAMATEYDGYVRFCEMVGSPPLPEKEWRTLRFSSACRVPSAGNEVERFQPLPVAERRAREFKKEQRRKLNAAADFA